MDSALASPVQVLTEQLCLLKFSLHPWPQPEDLQGEGSVHTACVPAQGEPLAAEGVSLAMPPHSTVSPSTAEVSCGMIFGFVPVSVYA